MGCITSVPTTNTHPTKPRSGSFTKTSISETRDKTISHINVSEIRRKCDNFETDYERILSSPGQLSIPFRFQKWFPQRHGHSNIRDLFHFHREISRSHTSSIHEITYKSQICVLKQIVKHCARGPMLFETEAQVLSKLRHSSIIGYIDMFFDEKYYYLVLQKADCDLFSLIKTKGNLQEHTTRDITYTLLKALRYLHRRNLVHRDLKPENIVFNTSAGSNTDRPLLIDFGDSEFAQKGEQYTEFVGTAPYMSPERSAKHYGWQLKKSDIFAIGTIAYEMFCGQRCFVGPTKEQVFDRVSRGEWSWPSGCVPSDEFKDFIVKCLQQDAKDRPSAKEALRHPWFDMNRAQEAEGEDAI